MAGAERAGGTPCHWLGQQISIEKNSEREGWGHGRRWPQLNRSKQQPAKISVGRGRDMEEARNCRGTYGWERFATVWRQQIRRKKYKKFKTSRP